MMKSSNFWPHLVAFVIVVIWGTTFVWTKLLIAEGISPAQIFTLRFIIAYLLLLAFSLLSGKTHKWWSDSCKDELIMILLGITGGSIYFLAENEALRFTTATNTSLIVCSCPLFTMLAHRLVFKNHHLKSREMAGSVIACLGMVIVVLNGRFILHLSPIGDLLAFTACLCWAVYSLLMRPILQRYSSLFITRKVFFYGIVTILPYYLIVPGFPSVEVLIRPEILVNFLFLGCIASMLCFLGWNWCISRLGTVEATNWVYLNPLATIVAAAIVLNEAITPYFLIGSLLILLGLYLTERKGKGKQVEKIEKR